MSDLVFTPTAMKAGQKLLRWCVYVGPHPNDAGWLMLFQFPNGLQASVAYGMYCNGLSVGLMAGESIEAVWDWLDGAEVVERLFEIMGRVPQVKDGEQ